MARTWQGQYYADFRPNNLPRPPRRRPRSLEMIGLGAAASAPGADRVVRVTTRDLLPRGETARDSLVPDALYAAGNIEAPDIPSLLVAGADDASADAVHEARLMAGACSAGGVAVIGAIGSAVGDAALVAAIEDRGRPAGVIAAPLDRPEPRSAAGLLGAVMAEGMAVSPFAPGAAPGRSRRTVRDRTMALMCSTVFIVGTGRDRSAVDLARHALGLGREVYIGELSLPAPRPAWVKELLGLGAYTTSSPDHVFTDIW